MPIQPKLAAKHFVVVLPQKRCGRWRGSFAVYYKGTARLLERSEHRVRNGAEEAARLDMRVLHEIRRRVDRQPRDAMLLHQFGKVFFQKPGSESSHLRVDIVGV